MTQSSTLRMAAKVILHYTCDIESPWKLGNINHLKIFDLLAINNSCYSSIVYFFGVTNLLFSKRHLIYIFWRKKNCLLVPCKLASLDGIYLPKYVKLSISCVIQLVFRLFYLNITKYPAWWNKIGTFRFDKLFHNLHHRQNRDKSTWSLRWHLESHLFWQ